MMANSLLPTAIVILVCLCTSQTSVSALNAASLGMKRNQNFTNEIQHGPNKLGASIFSVAPRVEDTLVVLAGQAAQLSFTWVFVNLSRCKNKELVFYRRKPPKYDQKVLLFTESASFSLPTLDPESSAYIGRVSVRITGAKNRVLSIFNTRVDDTNTYGIKVRCLLSHTNFYQEEIALVVKPVSEGNASLSRPVFVREPQDVWIKKRAVFHCKAKFAKWLFFRCENILGLKFKVTAGRSNTTLAAKMRIYRGQLMGEHTEATCYCQAIGRGAAIQHSRLARIRLTEAAHYRWSSWSEWEACSSSCGNGTQLSRRRCSDHGSRKNSFKMHCEQIRSQPCWFPCPGSINLTCPDEISVFNLTVKELFHRSWSIAPNLSHNSSDLELTMTVTHSALNFSTSLEIQLYTFSLPDIVLKGERNGSGIKYSKGNVTTANERENSQLAVPVICTVPTSSKPYRIMFSVRDNFRQRTACNFYATVHAMTQAASITKPRQESNSVPFTVSIVVPLCVCAVVGITIIAGRLRKKSRFPTIDNVVRSPRSSVADITICPERRVALPSPIYDWEYSDPCFVRDLSSTDQGKESHNSKNGCRHRPQSLGTLESWDPSIATISTSVRTSQDNFFFPYSSYTRREDHHSSCVNLTTITETAAEGVLIHDGTLSECSALNNSICNVPLTPRTRNRSMHSQKSAVSFGPSEISCITFNPYTDLPPSADPRYCEYGIVDYTGGRLTIENTGVSLYIPMFAIPKGESQVIYIALQRVEGDQPPLGNREALLSPIVICGPDGMQFQKSVFLTMPHCADVTDDSSWNMEVKSSQDASRGKSRWETRANSTDNGRSDAFCQIESRECTLIIDHFTKFCVVGRPQNAQGDPNDQSTKNEGEEGETRAEGATGGKKVQKITKEPKRDERGQERRGLRRTPGEEQKKEDQAYRLVAIVAYSSPPSVDKDCSVRVYCIPNLEASLKRLDDLEKDRYKGEISDAGHKVLKFEGSGENLRIKDIGEFKGWELSRGSKQEEEIPFDIVWKGLEDSLPPNIRFLYSRVDTNVYQFRREYEARQDKPGAKAVRFHANSSIRRRNSSSSGYCSIKPAEPIRYQIPLHVRQQLCYKLDPREYVISDWRHLAEKLGADAEYIRWLERGLGPGTSSTYELFDWWESKKYKEIPIGRLKQILRELGREDCVKVIDDYQNTEV